MPTAIIAIHGMPLIARLPGERWRRCKRHCRMLGGGSEFAAKLGLCGIYQPTKLELFGNFIIGYVYIYIYGYESIPINTIFRGMNIHLPAILMFTRGTRFWPIPIYIYSYLSMNGESIELIEPSRIGMCFSRGAMANWLTSTVWVDVWPFHPHLAVFPETLQDWRWKLQ